MDVKGVDKYLCIWVVLYEFKMGHKGAATRTASPGGQVLKAIVLALQLHCRSPWLESRE